MLDRAASARPAAGGSPGLPGTARNKAASTRLVSGAVLRAYLAQEGGMLIQRSQHAAVNDPERGTEPLYQPGNIDVASAGLELPVVPEGFSGGVKLLKTLEQTRGVRRQLGQVQFG